MDRLGASFSVLLIFLQRFGTFWKRFGLSWDVLVYLGTSWKSPLSFFLHYLGVAASLGSSLLGAISRLTC